MFERLCLRKPASSHFGSAKFVVGFESCALEVKVFLGNASAVVIVLVVRHRLCVLFLVHKLPRHGGGMRTNMRRDEPTNPATKRKVHEANNNYVPSQRAADRNFSSADELRRTHGQARLPAFIICMHVKGGSSCWDLARKDTKYAKGR